MLRFSTSFILALVALSLLSSNTNAKETAPLNSIVPVVKDEGKTIGSQALNLVRKVYPTLAVALVSIATGYNLGLASSGQALKFRPLTMIARKILIFTKTSRDTLFPNIKQPPELRKGQAKDELVYTTGTSSLSIVDFVLKVRPLLQKAVGKPKRFLDGTIDYTAYKDALDLYTNDDCFNRIGNEYLPKNYNYFGIYDGVGTMEAFLKYNPYIGASLKAKVLLGVLTEFEIDPYADSLFSSFVADLTEDVPRVVVKLNRKLKVTEMKVYLGKTLETRKDVSHLYSNNDKAYMALYQILYYAQNVHASTHVSSNTVLHLDHAKLP